MEVKRGQGSIVTVHLRKGGVPSGQGLEEEQVERDKRVGDKSYQGHGDVPQGGEEGMEAGLDNVGVSAGVGLCCSAAKAGE